MWAILDYKNLRLKIVSGKASYAATSISDKPRDPWWMPWKRIHNEIRIFSKEICETDFYWVPMITLTCVGLCFHFSYVLQVHKSLGIFSLNANESQLDLVPPRPSQVELFLWVACCEEVLSWGLGIVMNMPRQKGAGKHAGGMRASGRARSNKSFISKYFVKNTAREVWAGQVENTEEGWHTKQVWLAV